MAISELPRWSMAASPWWRETPFIPLPDHLCTNLYLGGPDLKTAYVTLPGSCRLVSLPWPRPGLR